jgi:hypothetical protein
MTSWLENTRVIPRISRVDLKPHAALHSTITQIACMHRTLCLHSRKASLPRPCRPTVLGMCAITNSSNPTPTWMPKEEGSIASVFSSLSAGSDPALPTRFSDLKKEIWRECLVQSWREVLNELEGSIEEVAARGTDVLELACMFATADTDKLTDYPVCSIFGFAEGTIDGSNLSNPGRRCPHCPGRRTKRGPHHPTSNLVTT